LIRIAGTLVVVGLLVAAHSGGTVPRASASALDLRVFGVNMGLFDSHEQLLGNTGTQQLVAGWHVPVIRIPTRTSLSDSTELLALQTVKSVGAVPLISVHGAVDSTVLADDTHLLGLVAQVFGSATVYVEYGNEEDLSGVDDVTYTNSWNAVVPSLKAAHPTYKFIGPVNFQKNPTYIGYFVGHAAPAPDIVSWHEYVCGPTDATSICLGHIANWAVHVTDTNNAEIAATGHTFPFMITEWNMDPQNDSRYLDPSVIQPFTTQALQELNSLIPSGLVGAQQYCVDSHGGGFELIDSNNSLTPQGQAFQAALSGAVLGSTPPPPRPSPTGPPPLSVSAAAAPGAGDAPVAVTFTGTAAGGTAPYASSWTFGDGATSASASPRHTYATPGTYTATLQLSDSKGLVSRSTTQIVIYPSLSVTTAASVAKGQRPPAVAFTASVQGGLGPYKFVWAFGDGATGSAQSAMHAYRTGTFQAALTVTDATGAVWTRPVATVVSTPSGVKTTSPEAASSQVAETPAPSGKPLAPIVRALLAGAILVPVGLVLWAGLACFVLIGLRRYLR